MATPTTLFEYFQQKGQALPSVPERRTMFGLGQEYAGTPEQNVALLNKLLTQAPTPTPTLESIQAGLQGIQTQIPTIQKGITEITPPPPPPVTPVSPTPSATDLTLGGAATPELPPEPTTTANVKAYVESMLKTLETQKQQFLDELKRVTTDAQAKQKISEDKMAALTAQQKRTLELGDPTKSRFYEQQQRIIQNELDAAETASTKIKEDYLANQALVGELKTLLTGLQSEVTAAEQVTGLAAIRNPRIAKLKEDVAARVGIIQATMNARTGQINMAYTIIDQAVDDVERDRKDQLAYYKTVYDFYGEQKDTEGAKLIQLTKDEKDFAEKQIKFLESEVKVSQDNVDYIKDLLVNPDNAAAMARAGVNLNMTIPEINKALADDGYKQEVIEISNDMAKDGFQYLATPEQLKLKQADPSVEVRTMTDSKGKTYSYWKEKKVEKADKPLSILDIARYQELYPDAGIVAGDTEKTANDKVAGLSKPREFTEDELRTAIADDKNKNTKYEDVLSAIDANTLIANKDLAKQIAAEVYGKKISVPAETEEERIQKAKKAKEEAERQGKAGYINEKGEFISLNPAEKITNSVFDFLFT